MAKQILMDLEEYNQEINGAIDRGFGTAIALVEDLLSTGGVNVTVDATKASPVLLNLINKLKDIYGKSKETEVVAPTVGS